MSVFDQEYLIKYIFSHCEEECRNSVYKVCKWWRKYYKWVNPKISYINSASFQNFKLAKQLFDCFGEEFPHQNILVYMCINDELHSHVLTVLNWERINPGVLHNYLIRWAAEKGYDVIVDKLLKDPRVDPTEWNNSAFRSACEHGHLTVVNRLLRDSRVDPTDYWNQAIKLARHHRHSSVVARLLEDARVRNAHGWDLDMGF